MTEKLFWQDAYQTNFTADVVQQYAFADGHAVILDRTCFYATSGGQPNDLGLLDQTIVKDVRYENGEIVHVLDCPLSG